MTQNKRVAFWLKRTVTLHSATKNADEEHEEGRAAKTWKPPAGPTKAALAACR